MGEREKFRVVVADPGWRPDDQLPGPGRGSAKHFRTGAGKDLVGAFGSWYSDLVADDAVLLCWRIASMQREALDLIAAWGFAQKSEIVWLKRTSAGRRHFGMGRQTRMEHEVCLIATRGRVITRDRAVRSTFLECVHGDLADCGCAGGLAADAEVLRAAGETVPSVVFAAEAERVHSRKPHCFARIVERLYPGPYLELFARELRPGWTCWGDDVPHRCGQCGQLVTPDRKPPGWVEPVCHDCLPPPAPLPAARSEGLR